MKRIALALLMLAAAGAVQPAGAAQNAEARPDRILVAPFANPMADASIFWLGEASAILLTDNLNALGASAITRPERRQAFERLQVPSAAVLTDATVIRIGQLVGAGTVILGSLQLDGDGLVVRARSLELGEGRVRAEVTERGPVADLFAIFDRIAARFAEGLPMPDPAPPPADRPPVAAFESYVKGLLAETPATVISYLNSALTRDPKYDRVRLALWAVHDEQGDHLRALSAAQAVPAESRWARRARFYAGLSQLNLQRLDDAFGTYKSLADEQPTPGVLNNLGVVQLRRGGTPQNGLPTYYFDKAAQADPDDPDYLFNLGYAYFTVKDYPAAMYWLRETVRRDPADGDAHFVLGAALLASGNAAEAAREKDLARRLSSTYEEWQKRPVGEQVPKGRERVRDEEVELPAFYLDRARRLFADENDREATADLDRALYLSPYLADAHLLLGRIHLRNGRVREAIESLKISLWSAETSEAHAVLADAYVQAQAPEDARAEAERALAMDPSSAEAARLLDMLKSSSP